MDSLHPRHGYPARQPRCKVCSEDYVREELTAEMCCVFINSLIGIDIQPI